ncbi:centrosome-associated protein 350-like [Gigantopelta aegis]|uniref:centrosome-associated protein 350-like n=1 Tax=Gigantopelta aegis TaxID=1735272 RepID=UPI001B88D424|nr:centrosome-associated protein 350-like [Gigantopelta aegis]
MTALAFDWLRHIQHLLKSTRQPLFKTDNGVKTKLSQGTRRKVSRLDAKYTEDEPSSARWVTSKKGIDKKDHARSRNRNGYDHRLEFQQRHSHGASAKRVDFLPNFQLREVNNDGTYLDSVNNPVDSPYTLCGLQSKQLDSHREKFKHFAGGDTVGNTFDFVNGQRTSYGLAQVPSLGNYNDSLLMDSPGSMGFEPAIMGRREGDAASKRGAAMFTDGKCKSRPLKKNLTDLPEQSESSRDESVVAAVPATRECPSDSSLDFNSQSFYHEPIHLNQTTIKERINATEKYPKGRKVASGPPVPVYKGFAEVDKRMFPAYCSTSKSSVKRSGKKTVTSKVKYKTSEERDETEKVKKVTRVIASENKSSKQGAKDIITTSSWRVGQELVRQKLGPARTKTQPMKMDFNHEETEARDSQKPDGAASDPPDSAGTFGINPADAKNISEESRKILLDLQLDHKTDELKKPERKRLTVKRKAPRQTECDKMQLCAKHHSNNDQIKKYIAKQRAERVRRQREEKRAQQVANQKRKQQLDELRKISSTAVKKTSRHRVTADEPSKKHIDHGLKEDHAKTPMSTKYMKLVIGEESLVQMELDDESSTLTGDTEDDLTPVPTPRDENWKLDEGHNKDETFVSGAVDVKKVTVQDEPMKKVIVQGKKLDIDVDSVLSVFSKYKQLVTGAAAARPDHVASVPSRTHGTADLKAIYEASASLRSRLQSERVQKPMIMSTGGQLYDRITGRPTAVNEFGGSLPGTTDWKMKYMAHDPVADLVGSSIQTVHRERIGPSLTSHLVTEHKHEGLEKAEESSLSETSTFEDVTEASESDFDNSRPAKMCKQLKDRKLINNKRHQPPVAMYKPSPIPGCDKPTADHYSVLNVFNRKMKLLGKENIRNKSSESERRSMLSSPILSDVIEPVPSSIKNFSSNTAESNLLLSAKGSNFIASGAASYNVGSHLVQAAEPSRINMASSVQPAFHLTSRDSNLIRPDMPRFGENKLWSNELKEREISHSERLQATGIRKDKDDDLYRPVLESMTDDSGAPSVESDEEKMPQVARQVKSFRTGLATESDSSLASEDEHFKHHFWYERVPPVGENLAEGDSTKYSPGGLEQKMMAELNKLESMEESLRQLLGIDRTHAVSLAQQETVSLAQILKSKQQAYEHDMQQLKKNVQKETTEAEKVTSMHSVPHGSSTNQIELIKRRAIRETARAWKLDHRTEDETAMDRLSGEDVTSSVSSRLKKRTTSLPTSDSKMSDVSRNSQVASVKTADDSINDTDTESSIRTVSDVDGLDPSKAESISEDIHGEDFSPSGNEESLTEDESFWQVLPSESHRKDVKKRKSEQSLPADELSVNQSVGDISSLFVGEDSFKKFTAEMVRQFMHDDLLRTEHQAAVLRLREKALKEKTKAELAWIRQQKQNHKKKGLDDAYPKILKQEKIIKKIQKEQEAEIHRLQEANELANKEHQLMLKQHEQMTKKHVSKQDVKLHGTVPAGRLSRPQEVHTEDEVSAFDEDVGENYIKECKSDSEVYNDKTSGHKVRGDKLKIAKQQKLRLDQKYLTAREHILFDRRKNAEDLLAWKKRLDEEELNIIALEQKAEHWSSKAAGYGHTKNQERPPSRRARTPREEKKVSKDEISEHIGDSLSKHGSPSRLGSELNKLDVLKTDGKKLDLESPATSVSDGSIPEEISSKSNESEDISITASPEKRMPLSHEVTSVAASVDGYENDTFEGDTSTNVSHKKSPVRRKLMPAGSSPLPSPFFHKAGSESESEDSISHTETLSDASDYEVRIRQLSDELIRRKKEVDILKRERKKKQKDKMKAHEEALKKQIEAYDSYIGKLKSEQSDLEQDFVKSVVKPMIKQPKILVKTSRVQPDVSPTKSQLDLESGGNSSGLEETDSNQTSPALLDVRELKLFAGVEDNTPVKSSYLNRISEGSESDKSPAPEKKHVSKEEKTENSVSEIIEEVSQTDSVLSEHTRSQSVQLSLHRPEVTTAVSPAPEKVPQHDDEHTAAKSKSLDVDTDVSEAVEQTVSKSVEPPSDAPFFDLRTTPGETVDKVSEKPSVADAVESDSESESQGKGTLSRLSSERSMGSNNYSEMFEDELLSLDSEQTPPPSAAAVSKKSAGNTGLPTNDDISEQISASLPSLSEKKSSSIQKQDMLSKDLDDLLGGLLGQEEDSVLLLTDPLADFAIEDRVLVWGQKCGRLLFKGKVDFAPGIWAGVELDGEEGDTDGSKDGVQYFSCKPQHGVLVPGSDISHLLQGNDDKHIDNVSVKSLDDSVTDISAATDSDLDRVIEGAAKNVELFDSTVNDLSPEKQKTKQDEIARKYNIAENITNELTESLLNECFETFGKINEKVSPVKKVPPPTLPKPKMPKREIVETETVQSKEHEVDAVKSKEHEVDTVQSIEPEVDAVQSIKPEVDAVQSKECEVDAVQSKEHKVDNLSNKVAHNLMDDAIGHMMEIRRKQRTQIDDEKKANSCLLARTINNDHQFPHAVSSVQGSDGSALLPVQTNEHSSSNGVLETPVIRPVSPVPGASPENHQYEQVQLGKDLDGLLGIEDGEFFDDDLGFDHKPPPPYPGSDENDRKVSEEIFYAVPHDRAEIDEIVASAVSIFWNRRRCGESMDQVEPTDSYFSTEDSGDTLESKSRHVYKQLLFNLTGEIIQDIYKDENEVDPPAWQKPKQKQQKYYKGLSPPTTIDILQPVVQNAVSEILGTHKRDKTLNKWNIRKKKDHVDNILVQELREEEANWVNYDEDEVAIKMQLTDTIFESLLGETVTTINGICNKRRHSQSAT